jgi:hypothetical protein
MKKAEWRAQAWEMIGGRGLLMARGKCEGQNRMRAGCDRK